jgi:hypothetical protein
MKTVNFKIGRMKGTSLPVLKWVALELLRIKISLFSTNTISRHYKTQCASYVNSIHSQLTSDKINTILE